MNKNKIFPAVFAILAAVVVTAAVVVAIVSPESFKKPYSFISTPAGSYVGRVYSVPFSSFIKLKDGYLYNNATDENQKTVPVLLPLKTHTIWGAESLYINKSQIIFKGRVNKCSDMGVTLKLNTGCPVATNPSPISPPVDTEGGE